jgi:hypothetical protein
MRWSWRAATTCPHEKANLSQAASETELDLPAPSCVVCAQRRRGFAWWKYVAALKQYPTRIEG